MQKNNRQWLIYLIAILIPIIPFIVIGELPGEKWLMEAKGNELLFGIAGAGLLASDLLLPIPSSILGSILGAELGFAEGCFWTWLGLCIGHILGYGIGRFWPQKVDNHKKEVPTLFILLITRPVPVLAEALTLICGALRMPFLPYLITMSIGNLIYALGLAAIGSTLLSEQTFGFGVFAILIAIGLAVIIWKKQKPSVSH